MEENNNLENIPGAVPTNPSTSVSVPTSTITPMAPNKAIEGFTPNTEEDSKLVEEMEEMKHRDLLSSLGHPKLPEEIVIKTFKDNEAERSDLLKANGIYITKIVESLEGLGYEIADKD